MARSKSTHRQRYKPNEERKCVLFVRPLAWRLPGEGLYRQPTNAKMRSESLQGERLLWSLPSKIWGVDWLYRSPPFADVLARNSNLVLLLIKVFNDYQIGWKAVGLYEYLSWKSNERDSKSVKSRNMKEVGLGTHFLIQEFSTCICMRSTHNYNLF